MAVQPVMASRVCGVTYGDAIDVGETFHWCAVMFQSSFPRDFISMTLKNSNGAAYSGRRLKGGGTVEPNATR
jgi:hypothetical protein